MKSLVIFCLFIGALSTLVYANDYEQQEKNISDEAVKGCKTREEKIQALRHFVYEHIKPVYGKGVNPNDVMSPIERLNRGVGWCNESAEVFMHLAQYQGIKTRLLFLTKKGVDLNNMSECMKTSPHSIAEAWDGDRWVIVDTLFDLDMKNKDGKMASRQDVKKDITLIKNTPAMKARKSDLKLTDEQLEEWLSCYYNPPLLVGEMNSR
ncbi:MAG: transglutaminase-like domain-containing protein [Candidatus Omnitrophica bacterium]|nr:transglutaminase-like domain-containing protein [Candidatus Omnitrophota bacterium]